MSTTRSFWTWFRPTDGRPAAGGSLAVTLDVVWPADVLGRVYPNGRQGGLTMEGPAPGALGSWIDLTVKVARPSREFFIKTQLAWARHVGSRILRESYGLDFAERDEAAARLLAFARQELDAEATRLHPRVVTDLPVRVSHAGLARREFLADISLGGAFVRTGNPLPAGTTCDISVRPPRMVQSLILPSRVVWDRSEGKAPGMGVEFLHPDVESTDRLSRVLRALASN